MSKDWHGNGRPFLKGRLLPWGKWEEQVWGASGLELIKEGTGQKVSAAYRLQAVDQCHHATQHRGSSEP